MTTDVCTYCGKQGHRASRCPLRLTERMTMKIWFDENETPWLWALYVVVTVVAVAVTVWGG